jgi:adenylyltransferase/sulfurtransferase
VASKADYNLADRYQRQTVLPQIGLDGQRLLVAGRVLIVGVGGLGTWVAELLARAGVGFLRLADDDAVELVNIHRQALYDETAAGNGSPKVRAAAARLAAINYAVVVDPTAERVDRFNLNRLARDVDLIIDGTDNFDTRFLINDYAVKNAKPWVFAGVIGTEAMTYTYIPGRTLCLRCLLESPPAECGATSCRERGILGPVAAAVAALQATQAIQVLSGHADAVGSRLLRFDAWQNLFQQINVCKGGRGARDCICCDLGEYEYLEP